MARDSKARGDDKRLDRRSYLKLAAGAAAIGGVSATGNAFAANRVNVVDAGADDTGNRAINDVLEQVHGDNTEVYFPPGTYRLNPISLSGSNWKLLGDDATIVVPSSVDRGYLTLSGSGWVVDGFTIDLERDNDSGDWRNNAAPINFPRGNNWTFKNVRFKGTMGDPSYRSGSNLLYPAIWSSSATGLIENVDMSDGSAPLNGASNRGGMWAGPNCKGHLILRQLDCQRWANNTVYVENVPGHVTIEDSFFKDTNVGVRVGGGTTVRNCVWVNTRGAPEQIWTGGNVSPRALIFCANNHYPGTITVENCDFTIYDGDGFTWAGTPDAIKGRKHVDELVMRDCRFDVDGIRAIYLNSEDGGRNGFDLENVHISGSGPSPLIRVKNGGGTARNVCVPGGSSEVPGSTSNISSSGCTMPRTSPPWTDGDSSTGETTTTTTTETQLPNALTIEGSSQAATYSFTVDGTLEKSTDGGASIDSDDTISNGTAEGTVHGGLDSYRFDGEITDFQLDGPATVYLNGQQVDPADLAASSQEHTLRIAGGTARQWTYYDFTVSGDLAKAEVDGASANDGDTVSGSSAEGFVAGGADGYRFTGELTKFTLDGDADVYLDGQQVDLAQYPTDELPNVVIIDGSNTSGESTYTFEVDGAVEKSRDFGSVTAEDTIQNGTVSGTVAGGTDSYRFSGNVTEFQLEGTATVSIQDNDG